MSKTMHVVLHTDAGPGAWDPFSNDFAKVRLRVTSRAGANVFGAHGAHSTPASRGGVGAHGTPGSHDVPAVSDLVGSTVFSTPLADAFPAQLQVAIDPQLKRWTWLVKWLFAIPHFVLLAFLWEAFSVLTFVAGMVILFTGRYPRRIFDFNVGVMRWTWRVLAYSTNPLCTDEYPPFTLEETDHPACLYVPYPTQLSRWLVLVKWWLPILPHYLIVGVLTISPRHGSD